MAFFSPVLLINLYNVKCCFHMASAFHGLPRKASPSDWFWDMFSIGCKVPCAVFPLSRPSTLAFPSCVPLSGWLAGWGKKPTEAGSSRPQAGRGNCLPAAIKVVSLSGHPSLPLFLLFYFWSPCRSLSFSLSLPLQISAFCLLPASLQVLS